MPNLYFLPTLNRRNLVKIAVATTALCMFALSPKHVVLAAGERVKDGSFEAGPNGGFWNESSSNFGTPLCSFAVCGSGSNTAAPRTGSYWVWFGGADTHVEDASVSQRVKFPTGSATLRFYLWIGDSSPDGKDWLRVSIDGQRIFNVKENSTVYDNGYVLVQKDVSQFADGLKHKLVFKNKCTGDGNSNFSVDDVSIQ